MTTIGSVDPTDKSYNNLDRVVHNNSGNQPKTQPPFDKGLEALDATRPKTWSGRVCQKIEKFEAKLDKKISNNRLQKLLDSYGNKISKVLRHDTKLNKWIDSNGFGAWYKKLGIGLAKLPLRAVRNILRMVYGIIKSVAYAFVHPLKAMTGIAKFLIRLIDALSTPETYTKIGAGMIGGSLGQLAVTGGMGVYAYIGLAIGGAMLIGGLASGSLASAIKAKPGERLNDAKERFYAQIQTVPESALTGFIMGAMIGAIKQSIHKKAAIHKTTIQDVSDPKAVEWGNNFAREHGLPPPTSVTVDSDGIMHLNWTTRDDIAALVETSGQDNYFNVYVTTNTGREFFMPNEVLSQAKFILNDQQHLVSDLKVHLNIGPYTSAASGPGTITSSLETIHSKTTVFVPDNQYNGPLGSFEPNALKPVITTEIGSVPLISDDLAQVITQGAIFATLTIESK